MSVSGILCVALPLVLVAAGACSGAEAGARAGRRRQIPRLDWEKRSDWISVKSDVTPAAAGDGVRDDTAAIQAALSLVREGTTVYLPPGTYRITKTLSIKGPVCGAAIIGHGRATKLIWDGPKGGRMYWSNGAAQTRYVGLVWDGRGRAAVGVDHDSKLRFESELRHEHEAFVNFVTAGIRIGHDQKLASAEILYENCLFEDCGTGVAIMQFNDYNNTFDGCEFRRCGIGIYDTHGNFYARNCHFEASRKTDFYIRSEAGSSVRRCTSVGSRMFVDHSGIPPLTIQDCHVSGWKSPDGAIVLSGSPAIVFDCVFTDPPTDHPPIRAAKGSQRLVISSNRSRGTSGLVRHGPGAPVVEIPPGKLGGALDTEVPVEPSSAHRSFLKDRVRVPGKVFDAKTDFGASGDGRSDDTEAIQKAIDAAREHGRGAIAYLPTGTYNVSETIRVTGADYFVGGSGFRTGIAWKGPQGGVMVAVHDPQDVTLQYINVGSHDVGSMNNGIDIRQTSSGGKSLMHYDGVYAYGMYQKQPFRKGFHFSKLPRGAVVHVLDVQGNMRFTDSAQATVLVNTSYEGSVTVEGKRKGRGGFLGFMTRLGTIVSHTLYVKDNHSIVMSDLYHENSDHHLSIEGARGDPRGRVTIQGAKSHLRRNENTLIELKNYAGQILLGHEQYYCEPNPAVIAHTGGRALDLVLVASFFYNTRPEFRLGDGARLALVANEGAGEDRLPSGTLERLALALDDLRRLGALDLKLNHSEAAGAAGTGTGEP